MALKGEKSGLREDKKKSPLRGEGRKSNFRKGK